MIVAAHFSGTVYSDLAVVDVAGADVRILLANGNGTFTQAPGSPITGIGSQMLPMNAWGNPAYWPFAFLDREVATDVSAIVAMGILALACYIIARCFDVPVVPSILAAQSTVLLFAPTLLLLHMPTVYCLTPGNAVVYAPHLVALGLLARVEPGSWRKVVLITAAIAALRSAIRIADSAPPRRPVVHARIDATTKACSDEIESLFISARPRESGDPGATNSGACCPGFPRARE